MSNARRSERLRRKRQSTPGLSAPGAYSLYGSGYVVESEASFLPQPASLPRRTRYKDSPHVFAADTSLASNDAPAPDDPRTPPRARRARSGLVDRVRVSLFDVLGSAARRPARNRWPALDDADGASDGAGGDPVGASPELPRGVRHAPRERQRGGRRALAPLALLAALLVLGAPVLVGLERAAHTKGGYYVRAGRAPVWASVQGACAAAARWPRAVPQAVPRLARDAAARARWGAWKTGCAVAAAARVLLRGAWSRRVQGGGDFVSRGEFGDMVPEMVAQARRAAAEEAAKVARELGAEAVGARGAGGAGGAESFRRFAERYAADKGLPADYALASVGGGVVASEPSVARVYARFVREYVEAVVRRRAFTPLLPNRPRMALTADVLPGNCWAFPGERGSLTIRVARPVRVRSVTLEHTPERSVFSSLSAPRRFRVTGITVDDEEVGLGEFVFEYGEGKSHMQSFVVGGEGVMRAVRVDFLSNHGAPHTSVYRVRVHGNEATDAMQE